MAANGYSDDEWDNVPQEEDPKAAEDQRKAVLLDQNLGGETVVIGAEDAEEWIKTTDLGPLDLEEVR